MSSRDPISLLLDGILNYVAWAQTTLGHRTIWRYVSSGFGDDGIVVMVDIDGVHFQTTATSINVAHTAMRNAVRQWAETQMNSQHSSQRPQQQGV